MTCKKGYTSANHNVDITKRVTSTKDEEIIVACAWFKMNYSHIFGKRRSKEESFFPYSIIRKIIKRHLVNRNYAKFAKEGQSYGVRILPTSSGNTVNISNSNSRTWWSCKRQTLKCDQRKEAFLTWRWGTLCCWKVLMMVSTGEGQADGTVCKARAESWSKTQHHNDTH